MTDKTQMPEGTRVTVRRDNGHIVKTVTRSKPWMVSGRYWLVLVEGISGGYSLERGDPITVEQMHFGQGQP